MPEHLHKDRDRPQATGIQPSAKGFGTPGAKTGVTPLQRTAGNRAVSRLLRETSSVLKAPPSTASPLTVQRAHADFPVPQRVQNLPRYRATKPKKDETPANTALRWLRGELESLTVVKFDNVMLLRAKKLLTDFKTLQQDVESEVDTQEQIGVRFDKLAKEAHELSGSMFRLTNREMPFGGKEGTGRGEGIKGFGYHMTKLHNLPSIKEKGLDASFGAQDRGSLAMSAAGQQKGSQQTSANTIAFGTKPETFRPYINQAEDRRQLISGVPRALKPVMLRFDIRTAIGTENVQEGLDYMDANALNTQQSISREHLEVLTADGWMALTSWAPDTAEYSLRDQPEDVHDDLRMGKPWDGTPIALEWKDVENFGEEWANLVSQYSKDSLGTIRWVERQRDREVRKENSGISYTFRGATMQTSAQPNTWTYVFTVKPPDSLPKWLNQAAGEYAKRFNNPAQKHIEQFLPN